MISQSDIVTRLDIERGDTLLIGSDVLQLALNMREAGLAFQAHLFIDDVLTRLGDRGTLLFPAFNFDFCQGATFDIRSSPTAMGSLSRAALKRPDFQRTQHPLHSFAVKGRHATELCGLANVSSFGAGSPFEFLHDHDGKMLIIGLPLQGAFTYAHYVEEREGVDYRYMKEFRGKYIDGDGRETERLYSLYVRDLERGVVSDLHPLESKLLEEGILATQMINGVRFSQLQLSDSYSTIVKDIRDNSGRSLYRLEPN